jgi:hypothetical protein
MDPPPGPHSESREADFERIVTSQKRVGKRPTPGQSPEIRLVDRPTATGYDRKLAQGGQEVGEQGRDCLRSPGGRSEDLVGQDPLISDLILITIVSASLSEAVSGGC